MKVRFTEVAASQFEEQIDCITSHGSSVAARKVKDRILSYIYDFLSTFPRAGRFIKDKAIFETVIPGTNYVLFYRLEEQEILRVLAVFHGAQDRSNFDPD